MNKGNIFIYFSSLGLLKLIDSKFEKTGNKPADIKLITYKDLSEIFQINDQIFKNQYKNILHLSTPFNRKIKYIYNLPFFYTEYENYNFNKLSDFFLNIHIFIN